MIRHQLLTRFAVTAVVVGAAIVPAACGGGSSVDTATFCRNAATAITHLSQLDPTNAGSVANELNHLAADAPDEIKRDVETAAAYVKRLDEGGSDHISKAEDTADQRLSAYLEGHCKNS